MMIAVVRIIHLPFSSWLFRHLHYSTCTPNSLERGMWRASKLFNPIRKVRDNAVHSHPAGARNVRRFVDRVGKDLKVGLVQCLYKRRVQGIEGQADMSSLGVDGKGSWMDRNRLQERHGLRTRIDLTDTQQLSM